MDTSEVFKSGGINIPNPNYNPKNKKNKEAPYIFTNNIGKYGNPQATAVANSAGDNWVMDEDYTRKYQRYGITPNRVSSSLDKELANAQSNWSKAANAIGQTLVSEIGLGTLLEFSDLFDMIGSKVGLLDDDYKNPVSEFLENLQEEFRNNVAPIYTTPGVDISNGGLLDFGWWASNIPSIASSLTLLIPSTGITKILSMLGKASKLSGFTRTAVRNGSKLLGAKAYRWANKAGTIQKANAMTELGVNAALSRTMENYQEARGVYNDMYDEASNTLNNMSDEQYNNYINSNPHIFKDENGNDKVDTNDKDAVAKFVAKQAADRDFVQNYVNIGWDVLQLYGLKNMFRGGKLPELGSSRAKIRRVNKDMIEYADKLKGKNAAEIADEIKELNSKLPFMTKVGRKLEDWTYGNAVTLGAEASEGAEEAWNYISQMEGMHTGRLLLGNDKASRWDNRAADYFQNPQLWESAFWGVLGGVVFQNVGGFFKKVGYNYSKYQDDKKDAAKAEKTGETPLKAEFKAFDDMPDVKRGVESVYARQVALMDLKEKKDAIKSGKNPYNVNKDITDEQKAMYEQMVTDDFITSTALQSYNNGTFNMTREYFANDNVRKGMVENGVVDENTSKAFQEEVVSKLDKVKEDFENETSRLNTLSYSTKSKKNIPMEYIQIAANHNVRVMNNIKDMENRQALMINEFDEFFNGLPEDKIDKNLPYKQMMDFQVKTSYLEKLEDDKRQIKAAHDEHPTISTQIALDNIDKQIKRVRKDIAGDMNDERAAYSMFTLNELLAHKRNQYREIDADIENIFADLEKGNSKSFAKYFGVEEYNPDSESLDNIKSQYKELANRYGKVESNLEQLGDAADSYRNAVMLGQFVQEQKSSYIGTRDEFDTYMSTLNNTMNEARVKAIDESIDKIVSLSDKHDLGLINDILYANKNDQSIDELTEDFTDDEKAKLNEALDVINLSSQANYGLYDAVANRLLAKSLEQAQQEGKNSAAINNAVNENVTSNPANNEEESSSSQQNQSESTESESLNNQSQQQSESTESTENNESSNVEEENNNQQSQNKYIKVNDKNVAIDNIKANEADGVVDDNNNVVPKNDSEEETAKFIKNKNLFDYEEGVSLIDNNYKIEAYPKIDNDGNLTKGRIVKVTTNTNNEESNNEEENNPVSSSTGGQEQSTQPQETSTNTTQQSPTFDPVEFENNVAATFRGRVDFTMNDEAIDKVAADIKERIIQAQPNIKADYISQVVDNYISNLKKAYDKIAKLKGIERAAGNLNVQAQVDSGTEALSSRVEETDTTNYTPMFAKAMDKFVEEYVKTLVVPTSNGKQVVNVQDILRICQSIFNNDTQQATNLYNMCKDYLLSEDAQKKYIVSDIDAVMSDKVVEESRKNIRQIREEEIGTTYSARVDIQSFINLMNNKNVTRDDVRKKYFETLDSLKAGDKVQLVADDEELIIRANGMTIGRMPKPAIVNDNTFIVFNEGWKTDVRLDKNGIVQGEFKDFVNDLFWRDNSEETKVLRQLISDVAINGVNRIYLSQFANNDIIASMVAQSIAETKDYNNRKVFVDKEGQVDYESLLNHLVKLWKFSNRADVALSQQDRIIDIKTGINAWFNKLYNSYSTISDVTTSQDVVIGKLTEGQINRKVDRVTEENKKDLPYAKDGIKDITNAKIAVVNPQNASEMLVSGKEVLDSKGWSRGSTVVAVYNRNNQVDYVKAIGVNFSGDENNNVKEIGNAIQYSLHSLFNDFFVDGDLTKLEQFFKQLVRSKGVNNIIPLLAPKNSSCTVSYQNIKNKKTNTIDHCLSINFYDGKTNRYIRIFDKSFGNNARKILLGADGSQNILYDLNKTNTNTSIASASVLNAIMSMTNLNIDGEGIKMDNRATSDKTGFITKKDGKVRLDIGDETHGIHKEFNSYNDFIIDNNLVRVNTYIDEDTGSNYSRISSIQGASQNMYVDIPHNENNRAAKQNDNGATERIEKNVDKAKYDELKESLNSNSNHKGDDLIKLTFGEEYLKDFNAAKEESGIFEDLFPTDIFYDDINYYSNKGVVGSIAQTNSRGNNGNYEHRYVDGRRTTMRIGKGKTVIGSRFLNMLASNSPFRRQVAARKLIHERIHQLLGEPTIDRLKVLSNINDIYKEVKQALINEKKAIDSLDKNDPNYKLRVQLYNDVKNTLSYRDGDIALEEFMVESMTNSSVAAFMNNIKVNDAGKATSETLFSKLMKFIAKFFGWDIKKDTLLEKEFNILSNMFEAKPSNESETKLAEEIKEETYKEDVAIIEEQNNSPVEESQQDTSPELDNTLNLDDNIDLEFNLDDILGGEDTSSANVEESNLQEVLPKNSETNTNSIPHFIESLDEESKENMQRLIDSGYASIKCS